MSVSRREFLGSSAAVIAGTMANRSVFGANGRVRVGVIGINGRGGSHIGGFTSCKDSEVTALCDVDRTVLERMAKKTEEATGKRPKTFVDMREMFASGEVDAVSIATPNHWHTLASVWACEAGLDVYVEKPLSHNVWEGRQLVNAAKKHGRIVQHGTQGRSEPEWIHAIQKMREGAIGDLFMARALCFKRRDPIGNYEESDPPETLDWNLWQGPGDKERRYAGGRYVHYNWHWSWPYGNGDIGNQGVHQMDIARWGLNKGLPARIHSAGGRYGYTDDGETPHTQVSTFTYADGSMLVFEVRGRATNLEDGNRIGNLFYGTNGYMSEDGFRFFDGNGKKFDVGSPGFKSEGHFANFIKAVKSRNEADVNGTALDGHLSSAHCHLANISYRLGRELRFDPDTERFVNDDEANALLKPPYRPGFEVPEIA